MRRIVVPGTKLQVSRFIFGTSSLLSVGSPGQRQRLLAAAADHGFTHFDTAPYYGFGLAERDLKPLLSRHASLTLTTKVGLYSPGGEGQSSLGAILRKAGGRILPTLSRPLVDWSVTRARASLDASLRRLGRERVDLYTLHEPRRDLLHADEWLRWLETEVEAGRVGHFGLALDTERLSSFAPLDDPLCSVVQTNDSLSLKEADILLHHGRPLQITFGYVSSARRGQQPSFDANAVLAQALRRNTSGAIIVSTRRTERLDQYSKLADA